MNRDYVITLILKARDEIAGAVAKALAEVEGLQKLAQKNGFKDLDADADRLSNTLRNKLSTALSEVRGNLNRTEADADKFERRYKSLGSTADEVGRKFKRFDIDETGRKLRRAETDAKSAGDELERLGKRTSKNGDEWDRMSSRLAKANDRIEQHSKTLRDAEKTAGELMKVTNQLSKLEGDHEKALERTRSAYEKQIESAAKLKVARDRLAMNPLDREKVDFKSLDREIDDERRKAAELGAEVEALSKLHPTINIDLDKGHFDEEAAKLEAEKTAIGSDIHVNVDMDLGGAEAKLLAFDAMKNRATGPPRGGSTSLLGWFRDIGQEAEENTHSIAAFDNALRGLAVLTVVAMSQQLLTIMTALGGELIAVASSAILAGSAIGGALTAGVAQALPAVGLLVAAFARVGAVISAIKQAETLRLQESYQGEKQEGQSIGAEEGVVNATEAVIAAKQNLRLAEIGLTKARFEARRELQDLILAEKQAELAAKGAALSQFQAQMSLKEAIRSGDISEVAGAQLEVASSRLSSRQANLNAGRAHQDLSLQERGSPLAPNQGIPDAERQVEQSVKALKQSERAAVAAKRSAAEAAAQGIAAAGKLNYMLSELDASEKRLYNGARRLYQTYKEVMRPITDIIINSFTYATNKGVEILKNPLLQSSFEGLAHSIGDNFKRIVDEFSSPRWVKFFSTMAKDAGQNLGPLTTAFLSLSRAFRSIAEAASPVLHDIVEWIAEGAREFEEWVGKGKGLNEFFKEGEHALEAWLGLAGAILKLFLALIGTSAKEGTSQVESLTDKINEATDYIEKHRQKVEGFFADVGEVMSVLGDVLLALGAEILRAFNVNSVKDLGNVIIKIIIPALGEAVQMFGRIAGVLSQIANNPAGEFMLKFVGSILILKAVLSPFISVLKAGVIHISKIAQMAAGLAAALSGVSTEAIAAHGAFAVLKARLAGYSAEQIGAAEAGVPLMASLEGVAAAGAGVSATMLLIPLAIAAVVAAFIYLSDQFGVLDDEWAAVREAGEGFVKPIIGPLEDLITQVEELLKALGILGGDAKGLGKVFEYVFIKVVKAGVIPVIKFFGSQLAFVGELIGGFFTSLSGVIEIITGILTLNFDKIEEGAGKLFKGLTTPFRAAFNQIKRLISISVEVIRELFGGIFRWLVRKASGIPGALGDAFDGLVHIFSKLGGRALHAITSGFSSVWGWIKGIPDKLESAGESIAKAFARGVTKLPKMLAEGFEGAGNFIAKIAGDITKYINDHTPFGDDIDVGLFSVHLPNLPEHFAGGGPVGKGVGTKDDQLGLLTRGEHVLTTEDVRNAGGHQAIFSWRRSLGSRAGQSRGGAYAEGGEVKASSQEANASIGLEALLTMIINFGGEATETWDSIWDRIQHRTAAGVKSTEGRFDKMEQALIQSAKRIDNQVVNSFDSMLDDVRGDVNQLTHVIFQGMDYIAEITEKALTAFGVKKVDLNIAKPKGLGGKGGKGKAEGGFVGNQGERGGDYEPTWLGRGEAVLHWGHQKIVEPAMQWYYGSGLGDMFNRTKGEHAAGGFAGYAKGRRGMSTEDLFDGHPSGVASSLRKLIEIMKTKWPLLQVSATTDHSYLTSSGNVSDHTTGHAVDLATPYPSMASYMNKAARWVITSGMYKQIKQGIHNPDLAVNDGELVSGPGFYQGAWLEHLDHIHLAVFDALRGAFGGAGGLSKVPKMVVKGTDGPLKTLAQGAIDKVAKAANKFIQSKIGSSLHGSSGYISAGVSGDAAHNAEAIMHALMAHGLSKKVAAGITGNALQESGWMPGSVGSGGGGLWGFTASPNSLADLQAFAAAHKKPWADIGLQVEFLLEHVSSSILRAMSASPNAAAAAAYFMENWERPLVSTENQARREQGAREAFTGDYSFAKGGIISELLNGIGGSGSAVPIFAHIGEWILNQRQQQRLAGMLGTSVDKLKGMLGFSGGPTSFSGGGESKGEEAEGPAVGRGKPVTALPLPNLENYSEALKFYLEQVNKELRRGKTGIDKKRKNLTDFITKLFTRIAADIEEMQSGWETIQTVLTTQINKFRVRIGKGGQVLGRKGQAEQILNLEIKQLGKELNYLYAEKGPLVQSLRLAQKSLRKARQDGNVQAEQAAQAAIKKFRDLLRALGLQTSEVQVSMLEKMEAKQAEQVTRIDESSERALVHQSTAGGQLDVLGAQEKALQKVMKQAKKTGNVELQHQIEEELEAIEGAKVEARNKAFERRLSALTTTASIQSAMGFGEAANATTAGQIPVWQEQKAMLESALGHAQAAHNAALSSQIEGEIQGLETSIAEATAALISQAAEAIETRSARAMFGIELGNRIADLREHFGNAPLRQQERGMLLHQETGVIASQLAETQSLLAKAQAEGFGPDVIIPLQEKVQDLGVKLQENGSAIYANTIAIRQAFIDQIQERQGFMGGIFGNLEEIVNGLGSLSGVVNSGKLTELIQAAGQQLGSTGWELRGQLGSFVGERLAGTSFGKSLEALAGMHGEELVAAVQHLDFKGIENFLGPGSEASKQFQALIQAILENEVAIIGNTKQLEEAMKENQIQSFTSTAWQWFRKAIFNGMGGLMPEYAEGTPFYEAAGGGEMASDGSIKAHRGELIIPAHYSSILRGMVRAGNLAAQMSGGSIPGVPLGASLAGAMASGTSTQLGLVPLGGSAAEIAALREELARRTQEINVEVNEAEPSDPTYLANRLAFAVRTPST